MRRILLPMFGLGGALGAACTTTPTRPEERPTVVRLIADDGTRQAATAPLALVNERVGCALEPSGPVTFREGDVVLAEVEPGTEMIVTLGVGPHEIVVDDGRRTWKQPIAVDASDNALVVACTVDPLRGPALLPLTLVGPPSSCPPGTTVKARAGGLVVELGVAERSTLYLPRGNHIVHVLGTTPEDKTVELGPNGAELLLSTCP